MKTRHSAENESAAAVDPLLGVNAKTSWYPAARSWSGGRRRILGPKVLEANYYHVMSRTCGGEVWFDDIEKEALRRVLWRVAEFCGVQVLTYCIMGNHFHALIAVPHRATFMQRFEGPEGENRLLGHLRTLYSKNYIEQLEMEIAQWRRLGLESMVQNKLESFKRRMADLSQFVKEVKERYSRWFNKRRERRGTLWMDRFKSVLVEGSRRQGSSVKKELDAVRAMAAYIDLNPVRAGLVKEAREYAWSGYGEACAGKRRGQRGLSRVLGRAVDGWEGQRVEAAYAGMLTGVDGETGRRRSGEVGQVKEVKEVKEGSRGVETGKGNGGRVDEEDEYETRGAKGLSMGDLVRQRVRAFSEGAVLGSKAFVEEVFAANRRCFGPKRKEGARRMRGSEAPFYVARRVRDEGSG